MTASLISPMIAIEIIARVFTDRVLCVHHAWIPMGSAEDFVRALAALDNLDMFGVFLRQEIKADSIVPGHRLRHGRDYPRQRRECARRIDLNALALLLLARPLTRMPYRRIAGPSFDAA